MNQQAFDAAIGVECIPEMHQHALDIKSQASHPLALIAFGSVKNFDIHILYPRKIFQLC